MECGYFQRKFGSEMVSLFIIYHIPSSSVLQFCEEMVSILENSIKTIRNKIPLMGDFNIHMDRPDDPNTIIISDLLWQFKSQKQHIIPNTHLWAHIRPYPWLPKWISCKVCGKKVTALQIIVWYKWLSAWRNLIQLEKSITCRKLNNINETDFRTDLNDHLTECNTHDELEAKIDCYNNVILSTLEKHVPKKTKFVKATHKQLWFPDKIKAKIRLRCRKESTWNKDANEYKYQAFYNQSCYCSNIIKSAQR